jgi:hypothetical protein
VIGVQDSGSGSATCLRLLAVVFPTGHYPWMNAPATPAATGSGPAEA